MVDAITPHNILVIKLQGVGDVIWATPFLTNLRQGLPAAKISFLTREFCVPVLENNPNIDELITLRTTGAWQQWSFLREIRNRGFDLVIDLIGTPRSALITMISGARWRLGYDFGYRRLFYNRVLSAREANQGHEVDFHLFALASLGLPVITRELYFKLNQTETAYRKKIWDDLGINAFERVVGLVPTSGSLCRRWPEGSYAKLARYLAGKTGIKVLVFWGLEQEHEAAKRIAGDAGAIPIPRTSLRQMAALLSGCDLVIGNNCGPVHLASALKVPVISFHGPTSPVGQGAYGSGNIVVRNESLPCLNCNKNDCKNPVCMTGIEPVTVMNLAEQRLRELAS
jgi:lipopolysaccharide heptosyltransferase II